MGRKNFVTDVSPKAGKVVCDGVIKEMDFPDAMRCLINGQKIRRLEWGNPEYYCFLNQGFLAIHKPDSMNYQWIINDGDLMGEDWVAL